MSNNEMHYSRPQEEVNTMDKVKNFVKGWVKDASYLNSMADMMNQWRSFATVKLPLSGSRTVCTITNTMENGQSTPHVLIASTDGYLYVYDLNVNDGGDCTLIRQHR